MNVGGWLTMIASLVFVWGLTFWCFRRVLSTPEQEQAPAGFGP